MAHPNDVTPQVHEVPEESPGTEAPPRRSRFPFRITWYHVLLVVLGVGLLIFFNQQTDGIFLSQRNITLLLKQSAILGVVSAGMVVLIIARQIDLSAGASVYLVSVVVAQLTVTHGVPVWAAVLAGVAVGLTLGAFQGLMVARFAIPAFIVTLAGSLLFKGLGYVWTKATAVGPAPSSLIRLSEGYVPPVLSAVLIGAVGVLVVAMTIRRGRRLERWVPFTRSATPRIVVVAVLTVVGIWVTAGYNGLPMAVLIAGLVVTGVGMLLSSTSFGRGVYAVGGNPQAAHLAGIRVPRFLFRSFLLMGLVYGVAGVLMTARLGGAAPSAGNLLELDAIAAAVIGGTSFAGGIGAIPGALVGALLLTAIDNAMSLMNVSSFLQMVIKGAILLAAVWFDLAVRKKRVAKGGAKGGGK